MTIGGGPRWRRKRPEARRERFSAVDFDREASQTRGSWVAKNATLRAARPDSSPRKERLFGMTSKLHHYTIFQDNEQKQGHSTRAHFSVRGEPCPECWPARVRKFTSRRAGRGGFYAQGHKPGLPSGAALRAPASLRPRRGGWKKTLAGAGQNQQVHDEGIVPPVHLPHHQAGGAGLHRV